MPMTRRQFLSRSAAAAATLSLAPRLSWIPGTGVSYAAGPGDAIVVFVQLYGGNDGINTVYPISGAQRTQYEAVRPTLQLPKTNPGMQPWIDAGLGPSTVNDIGGNANGSGYALHPAMGALRQIYAASPNHLAVVPGVHYPFADHSHFRSMAIWWTLDPLGSGNLGWFGKYLNANPATFPPTQVSGVTIGEGVNPLFVPSQTSIFAFDGLWSLQFPADDDVARKQAAFQQIYTQSGGLIGSLPELGKIGQTGAVSIDRLQDYYRPGSGLANAGKVEALLLDADGDYDRDNDLVYASPLNDPRLDGLGLARDLRHVAATIRANVGARFFHVSTGGFDTHSNQERDFWHSSLLWELSESLAAFYQDMRQGVSLPAGYAGYLTGAPGPRVVVVTFSEFGRTIHQNSTNPQEAGTDHATSAPLFVLGEGVVGGQYGAYPDLGDPADDGDSDLKMTSDFRDVFGTILARWLGVPLSDLGPGPGKLLPDTPTADDQGRDYTVFTPIDFLAP